MRLALAVLLCACACATAQKPGAFPELPDPMPADAAAEAALDAAWKQNEPVALAQALEARRLPLAAMLRYDALLRDGASEERLAAVEGLVRVQRLLGDRYFVPSALHKFYDPAAWQALPPETLERVHVQLALLDYRMGKLDETVSLAETVRPASPARARALYIAALALVDPRSSKRDFERALGLLQELVSMPGEGQDDFEQVRALGLLGLGRITYGMRRYGDAVRWYAQAEQAPDARAEALLEGAFAKYQNHDPAGALAALDAPELNDGRWPEAAILGGIIRHFSRPQQDVELALKRLEKRAPPEAPRRYLGVARGLDQAKRERAAVVAAKLDRNLTQGLLDGLDAYATAYEQVRQRLGESWTTNDERAWRGWNDMADIIRLESAKAPAVQATLLQKLLPKITDGSDVKGELLFRLAEAEREAGNAPEGMKLLDALIQQYDAYHRRDEVLLRAGETAEQLGKLDVAIARYEQLLSEFPASRHAEEARRHLARIRAT